MKKHIQSALSILLILSLTICCKTETTTALQETAPKFSLTIARKEIDEANKRFMELVSRGDSIGLANFYTIDGKFMSAGAPAVVGRDKIQKAMSDIIKSGITRVDFRTSGLYGSEEMLAEEGELTLFVKEQAVSEEKYIVLWKKENGEWKLFRDIFNANAPGE